MRYTRTVYTLPGGLWPQKHTLAVSNTKMHECKKREVFELVLEWMMEHMAEPQPPTEYYGFWRKEPGWGRAPYNVVEVCKWLMVSWKKMLTPKWFDAYNALDKRRKKRNVRRRKRRRIEQENQLLWYLYVLPEHGFPGQVFPPDAEA